MSSKTDRLDDKEFTLFVANQIEEARNQGNRWYFGTQEEFMRAVKLRLNMPRISLWGANLDGVDLSNLDFDHSRLAGCSFRGANLQSVSFTFAELSSSEFDHADLRWANMNYSELMNCDFSDANLEECGLYNTDIHGAHGLKIVVPVGERGRLVYAFTRNGKLQVQAGCRCDTVSKVRAAIRRGYHADSPEYADYMDAMNLLAKWGKRELARLAE